MSRWSPTVDPVRPQAPDYSGIGDALSDLGSSLMRGRREREARRYRDRRDQIADTRYADEQEYARGRDAAADARQAATDERTAREGMVQTQGTELRNRGLLRDDGYVPEAELGARERAAGSIRSGGAALAGAAPGAGATMMLGDALLAAMDDAPSYDLALASGGTEQLRRDPTQTADARTQSAAIRDAERKRQDAERTRAASLQDDMALETHRTNENIRQHRATRPTGGGRGGGTGGIGDAIDDEMRVANARVDDARTRLQTVERQAPTPPSFDRFQGDVAPIPGDDLYPAFQADSTAKARGYSRDSAAHATRTSEATRSFEKWNSIADSLATTALGLSGSDAIQGSQQVQAAAEQRRLAAELNARLAEVRDDPEAVAELRQRFTELSQAINEKYGLHRRRPED